MLTKIFTLLFFLSINYAYSTSPSLSDYGNNSKNILSANIIKKKDKKLNGWYLTGNYGIYQANKHSAKFYNGKESNPNKLSYVFNNQYWYQKIVDEMMDKVNRDSFKIAQLPLDMKYGLSMFVGFSARYFYERNWALNLQFNHTKLQTADIFRLQVFPPFTGEVESYVDCKIRGVETRTTIDIGMIYTFNPKEDFTPFVEFGFNINNTLVKESRINIFDEEYNLVDVYGHPYVPNVALTEYDIRQGGIGFGGFGGGGIRYVFNKLFAAELAGTLYYKSINLDIYNKHTLHGSFMLRLVISPFFAFSKQDENVK